MHERLLRSVLWQGGFRFHKNVRDLPGKPDIVFSAQKVAVFCDGDFWHGRNWKELALKLEGGSNPAYWTAKIASNRRRDISSRGQLENMGWEVLRFWESEIKANPQKCADQIAKIVISRRAGKVRSVQSGVSLTQTRQR